MHHNGHLGAYGGIGFAGQGRALLELGRVKT
jgi:hypothetical protein